MKTPIFNRFERAIIKTNTVEGSNMLFRLELLRYRKKLLKRFRLI